MRNILIGLFLILCFIKLEAHNIQAIKSGLIHEAFVTKESGNEIVSAIAFDPPAPITEEKPQAIDPGFIWIPGYYAWSREYENFVWISGVWRRPPDKHHWVAGYWKHYPQGWVWISGFWSSILESELQFIAKFPPNPAIENIPSAPKSTDSYVWMRGYWDWDFSKEAFRWMKGRWQQLDRNLVYTPAQYFWREKGYLLVPGYWDWPIEKRGVAFANVLIPEYEQKMFAYGPTEVLSALVIMEVLFPHWPSYASLFQHHFYTHPTLWSSWGASPPWWRWEMWWGLSPSQTWWLWWWWSHPHYPNPPWMTQKLANKIYPPSAFAMNLMKKVPRPCYVLPNGVVESRELIHAIAKITKKYSPIIPSFKKVQQIIQRNIHQALPQPPFLKPTGIEREISPPSLPHFKQPYQNMKLPPGRLKTPDFQIIGHVSSEESIQGSQPDYEYPQTQMQTKHLDDLMLEPQPQENPTAPKAHPLPKDQSTLPNY